VTVHIVVVLRAFDYMDRLSGCDMKTSGSAIYKMMKKTYVLNFIQQSILIVAILFFYSVSTYYDHIARRMTERFLAREAGPFFLLSYILLIIVGILLFWLLPIGKGQLLNRQNILVAIIAGVIPFITLMGRVSFRVFLSQSFISIIMPNYYLLQWTVVSTVPLIWLGMVLGWWLKGSIQRHREADK